MSPDTVVALASELRQAIDEAPTVERALEVTVQRLAAAIPSYTWVGIYLLHGSELILGPFVGKPSPHTRIPLDRGICGAAASQKATVIVDDVTTDPRYLACSVETRSEIVVPIMNGPRVLGEIDIDSDRPAAFGEADRVLLENLAAALAGRMAAGSPLSTIGNH